MSDRITYHVVPTEKGWSVQREGDTADWRFFATKEEAVQDGTKLASSNELGQLIIHNADGKIEEERTYGDDPRRTPG